MRLKFDEDYKNRWEKDGDNYLYGEVYKGCGVFRDGSMWSGNSVLNLIVFNIGKHKTLKLAKKAAIKQLKKMIEYNESVA